MNKEMIKYLKNTYPAGTRLVLLKMNDLLAPVEPGTVGSVQHVDDIGQIHMVWDNGRTLALVPGEDKFAPILRRSFFTPLQVNFRHDAWQDYEELTADEAASYMDALTKAIYKDFAENGSDWPRGLAEDLDQDSSLNEKVYSIRVIPMFRDRKIVAVINCELKAQITNEEMHELAEYLLGQLADGWGESMAQQDIKVSDGEVQIEFYAPGKDNSLTEIHGPLN